MQSAQAVTLHLPDGSHHPFQMEGRSKSKSKHTDASTHVDNGALSDDYAVAARDADFTADREVRAAIRAIAIGRESMVSRIMTSNGVAPREAETAELLNEMHPKLEDELILPEPEGPQLTTTAEACYARIRANSGSITAPIDLYGFSDETLCHDKGQPKLETLSWEIARLQELLGSGNAPAAIYFMMVTGALTPINKDEANETRERIEKGGKRRLRPVYSGSGILKTPLREALSQPAAKRALAELLPMQMGQGMQSGPQTKVFMARLLFEAGYFTSLQDAINAFNAIHRQVLLDSAKVMWPEATLLTNRIYGPKAPCLYVYTDSAGMIHVKCMLSEHGARMGCVFGGTLFNMGVHLRIYKKMAIEFPGFIQRALTDDFSQFGKPAADTVVGWTRAFDHLAKALERYDELANPIGIFRHPEKGQLLLPPNAPDPPAGHRIFALTKITRKAVRIAGGHSGDDFATKAEAMLKAEAGARRVRAAARLAKVDPQGAMKIIGYASHHTMDYYWGVTPTHIVGDAVKLFQEALIDATDAILSPEGYDAPECHVKRHKRAHQLLALPGRSGGGNITAQSTLAPAAFLATTCAVLKDPCVANLSGFLAKYVDAAYTALYASFEGIPPLEAALLTKGFPKDTKSLFSTFTAIDLHLPPKRRMLQSKLTGAACTHQRRVLRASCDTSKVEPSPGQSVVDMLQVQLVTSRSQQSRVLQAPLYFEENRVAALPFVFFMRYYLGLPRLLRKGRPTTPIIECGVTDIPLYDRVVPKGSNGGYVEEVCALNHDAPAALCPSGKHGISCVSSFAARFRAHNMYTAVTQRAVGRLHCVPCTREPKTQVVLMDEFSAEECRALCPKDMTADLRLKALDFHQLMMSMAAINLNNAGASEMLSIVKAKIGDALQRIPKATKGVRLDLAIAMPDGTELLVDFTGIHPTAAGAISQLKLFVRALDLGNDVSAGVVANNPSARQPSPAVVAAVKLKEARYRNLMDLANGQLAAGKRTKKPVLISAVITHLGELSPDTISLVERLTSVAGKEFKARDPYTRGLTKAKVTGAYRSRFKDALLAANARGFGEALIATGNPIAGWVPAPDDACLPGWDVRY